MTQLYGLSNVLLQLNQDGSIASFSLDRPLDLVVLPIMIGWVMLFALFIWAICVAFQDGMARLKRLHQIPCDRCAYFTGNTYLKCTVQPCRAFTEDALGCIDFEPAQANNVVRLCIAERHPSLRKE